MNYENIQKYVKKRNKNIFLDIFIWNYNVVAENALTNLKKGQYN